MTYIFYGFLCLFLIVIQTVILPEVSGTQGAYDLLMIFAFYLSLFRSVREGLPVILIIGFIKVHEINEPTLHFADCVL